MNNRIQWNPSKADTVETHKSVLIIQVALISGGALLMCSFDIKRLKELLADVVCDTSEGMSRREDLVTLHHFACP